MFLTRLEVSHLRNLTSVSMRPVAGLNVIAGPNGSGKTSLLEAVHMLGLGRSFRSQKMASVIQGGQDALIVFAEAEEGQRHRIGVRKDRRGGSTFQVDGQAAKSAAELASTLPLQTITPDSHILISGGPRERRAFLDWGLFHVEQDFFREWRGFERALRQRNALLRSGGQAADLAQWTRAFAGYGSAVDRYRKDYVAAFEPIASRYVQALADDLEIEISYLSGWTRGLSLTEALDVSLERDRSLGFTTAGPHRADLQIRTACQPASATLSRGQQKLVVCALRLAQIAFLEERIHRKPVVLVDDLAAELDSAHRERLMELLSSTGCQLFVTGTDAAQIPTKAWAERPIRVFHVEHGTVTEMV